MSQTFRLRKSVKYQGMVFSAILLAAVVGYACIFFLDAPAEHGFKGEHSVAIIGGMGITVFGAMLLMSLYIWAAYYVERFTIDGTTIHVRSMLQNRRFDMFELQNLRWRERPVGGSILFRTTRTKARVDLHGYSQSDRLRIIEILRRAAPSEVQEGWEMFCHKIALPLQDGMPPMTRTCPSVKLCTVTRGRYDRMLVIALPLSMAIALISGVVFARWEFLALPVLTIGAWLLLRFHVPHEGRIVEMLGWKNETRASLVGMGAIVLPQLVMIGLLLLYVEASTACGVACVFMIAGFVPFLYLMHRDDKRRRNSDEQAAQAAASTWQQAETSLPINPPNT